MKINTFQFNNGMQIPEISLGNINLFVGNTGTGKSFCLNQMFNLGRSAVNVAVHEGEWKVSFSVNDRDYRWELKTKIDLEPIVEFEELTLNEGNGSKQIVFRKDGKFIFNQKEIPPLSKSQASIYLLKDEESIKPIFDAFSHMMRRDFSANSLEQINQVDSMTRKVISTLIKEKDGDRLFKSNLSITTKLYVLREAFKQKYEKIVNEFKRVFPFIEQIDFKPISETNIPNPFNDSTPIVVLKEKGINKPLPLFNYASGMKKVLMILTDIITIPDGSIYLIDEYENSLGSNAINFFPEFLEEYSENKQIILTSHHPYIINKIPVENWLLFHRVGTQVQIKSGQELSGSFGKSKQDTFIQLINDPFYLQGIA